MSYADIESGMAALAVKARDGNLAVEDMDGGTFTISNGGVFGSLMGTPIINPPQSAILGMHGIFDRPVARNGQVIRAIQILMKLTWILVSLTNLWIIPWVLTRSSSLLDVLYNVMSCCVVHAFFKVVIRPMMYIALTYDHRLIDGREAVTFLRKIKACVEDPRNLLLGF